MKWKIILLVSLGILLVGTIIGGIYMNKQGITIRDLLATFLPAIQEKAVVFDATSSATGNRVTSYSFSHTTSGTNRLLVATVAGNAGDFTVTNVSYGAIPLTFVRGDEAQGKRIEVWRLIAPKTGANTLVVTISAAVESITGVVSFTGVDQTNPIFTNFTSGNSGVPTININSSADNFVMDTVAPTNAPTVGTGQTQRWNLNVGGRRSAGSTEAGASTVTMNWTQANSPWAIMAIDVIASVADTTSPKWSSNTTNGTQAGTFIQHSVNWTDDVALSGYIFSFDNGTGTFSNNSFVTFTGTQNWSNVTKWVNTTVGTTIRWFVWANDSSNNLNSTNTFSYNTTTAPANCWSKSGSLLIIPSGCIYIQSSGTIRGIP